MNSDSCRSPGVQNEVSFIHIQSCNMLKSFLRSSVNSVFKAFIFSSKFVEIQGYFHLQTCEYFKLEQLYKRTGEMSNCTLQQLKPRKWLFTSFFVPLQFSVLQSVSTLFFTGKIIFEFSQSEKEKKIRISQNSKLLSEKYKMVEQAAEKAKSLVSNSKLHLLSLNWFFRFYSNTRAERTK